MEPCFTSVLCFMESTIICGLFSSEKYTLSESIMHSQVDEEKGEIEYAVTAKTTSYVAWGLRAASVKGSKAENKDKKKKKDEDTGEEEPAPSGIRTFCPKISSPRLKALHAAPNFLQRKY